MRRTFFYTHTSDMVRVNFRRERHEAIEKHRQPGTIDFHPGLRAREAEARKRPAFETLVAEPQSVSIEEEDLQAIATPVREHEKMTGERIVAEDVAHHLAEAVVGLAEVHGRPRHEDTHGIG
jgi:hypothetical protein